MTKQQTQEALEVQVPLVFQRDALPLCFYKQPVLGPRERNDNSLSILTLEIPWTEEWQAT